MKTLMSSRSQTLYIEGMDCSGKSTLVKELMERNGLTCIRHRHRVMSNNDNPYIEKFHKLKSSVKSDSNQIASALIEAVNFDIDHYDDNDIRSGEIIIQESTLLIKGMAMRMSESPWSDQLSPFYDALDRHPRFRSIVLTANKRSRQNRLVKRKEEGGYLSENDLMIINDYSHFEMIEKNMIHLMKTYFNAVIIDTSYISPKEISDAVIEIMHPVFAHTSVKKMDIKKEKKYSPRERFLA